MSHQKKSIFWIGILAVIIGSVLFLYIAITKSRLDILPEIIKVRNHGKPKRTPDTFAEDFKANASEGKLIFHGDSTFSFAYTKSEREGHSFSGVFFPLENLNIDFSQYDAIEIGIKTDKARRIPFNLSVQNKLETHQYVRSFIEVRKNQDLYTLRFKDFFTPTSWYDQNQIAQIEIPKQDFAKIEALSFESCHLLDKGIRDEFTIHKLILKKNLTWTYIITITLASLSIILLRIYCFDLFNKGKEVIHIPIKHIENAPTNNIEDNILAFLAENYTNPNLSLSDIADEFGKSNNDLSKLIKEKTEKTFPKYITFLRIEEAKRILKNKEYQTISEVGYTVGFNSPSNFIRVFKGEVGVSPKVFSEQ